MEEQNEQILKGLKQKFNNYDENKEEIKKSHPILYDLIEYFETKLVEEKDQKLLRKNMVHDYHLKNHFGVLTAEEIKRQNEVDALNAKWTNLSLDLYLDLRKRNTKYFDDVKVLLTYDYPYHIAFKIGNSIEDSEYIECSLYDNDIYKIINIFLKTGEKVHDV